MLLSYLLKDSFARKMYLRQKENRPANRAVGEGGGIVARNKRDMGDPIADAFTALILAISGSAIVIAVITLLGR